MYLISVEGGDGSGKGEAVRLLGEIAREFPFPGIHITHEPRRHSKLGKLALESVQKGDKTPLQEAGLFAADRLDHSHTWVIPILESHQKSQTQLCFRNGGIYLRTGGNCREVVRKTITDS